MTSALIIVWSETALQLIQIPRDGKWEFETYSDLSTKDGIHSRHCEEDKRRSNLVIPILREDEIQSSSVIPGKDGIHSSTVIPAEAGIQLIKEVHLARPTKIMPMLRQGPDVSALSEGLKELVSDSVIPEEAGIQTSTVIPAKAGIHPPLWFFIPNEWVQRFTLSSLSLEEVGLKTYIHWEVEKRFSNQTSDFRILTRDKGKDGFEIFAIRDVALKMIEKGIAAAHLKLSGITVNPQCEESYDLEPMNGETPDFRDAVLIDEMEHQLTKSVIPAKAGSQSSKQTLKWVAAVIAVALFSTTGYYLLTSPKIRTSQKEAQITSIDVSDLVQQEKEASVVTDVPLEYGNPISQFINMLPRSASLRVLVVSPVELRAEILGIPEIISKWYDSLRTIDVFRNLELLQDEEIPRGTTMLFTDNWGIQMTDKKKDITREQDSSRLRGDGLSATVRSLSGKKDRVLKYIDDLWKDMDKSTKWYISQNNDDWIVVVR